MLAKYQDEVVPKLREQTQPFTEEELFALKVVAHGCNTNRKLVGAVHLETVTGKSVSYSDAIKTVYALIERLKV
jgi:hypothetical protein